MEFSGDLGQEYVVGLGDFGWLGGLGGTRTPDALLRTEALYPLSYEAAESPVYSPSKALLATDGV